jgi:hypothetical protein
MLPDKLRSVALVIENEFSTSESALVSAIPFAGSFIFFASLVGTIDDLFTRASDFDEAVGKKQFAVIPYSRFVRVQDNRNHLVSVA